VRLSDGQALLLWQVTCIPESLSATPMTAAAEVIDLTGLPSSPLYLYSGDQTPDVNRKTEQLKNSAIDKDADVPLEDGELPRAVKPTNPNPRKQRKRKKTQQDPTTAKEEIAGSGDKRRRRDSELNLPSRGDSRSPPNRTARRRALREKPSDPDLLFFVDDKPADIRGPYASTALAGPSRTQQNGGLVLPPHVNVTDGSSETQEPSLVALSDAEEGEEDFIDYLEIDGDRSVCIPFVEPLVLCTLIQKMKDRSSSLFPRYPRN